MRKNISLFIVMILSTIIYVGQSEYFDYANFVYCGMPSDKVFSITSLKRINVNYYYPTNTEVIKINSEKFRVLKVTPEYIEVDWIKK